MLPSYFNFIFVYLRQKVRLRPDLSPTFLSTLGPNQPEPGPNPTRKARPDLQLSNERIDLIGFIQYLNCKILHGGTLLQP